MNKKLLTVLIVGFCLSFSFSQAATYRNFWKEWIDAYKNNSSAKPFNYSASYKNKKIVNLGSSNNTIQEKLKYLQSDTYNNQFGKNRTTISLNTKAVNDKFLVNDLSEKISVMDLNFYRKDKVEKNTLAEAIIVRSLKLKFLAKYTHSFDYNNLLVHTNYSDFSVNKNGECVVTFNKLRLTEDSASSIPISISFQTDGQAPANTQYFEVSVTEIDSYYESSYNKKFEITNTNKPIQFSVQNQSVAEVSNSAIISRNWQKNLVDRRMLSGGDFATVLTMTLRPELEDMTIKQISLRDIKYNGVRKSFIRKIRAIKMPQNTVLAERIGGGELTNFIFTNELYLKRNTDTEIAFVVEISPEIFEPLDQRLFQFDVQPSDTVVNSVISGKELADSQKYFRTDSREFIATRSGITIFSSATQPNNLDCSKCYNYDYTQTPPVRVSCSQSFEDVYQFTITNTGSKDTIIKRISADVALSGVEFDDNKNFAKNFDIEGRTSNNDRIQFEKTINATNSSVVFDFTKPFYITAGKSQNFMIRMKLLDSNYSSKGSVAIQIMKDSEYKTGSLETLKTGNSNIIWSDGSSQNYQNGYLVPQEIGYSVLNEQ